MGWRAGLIAWGVSLALAAPGVVQAQQCPLPNGLTAERISGDEAARHASWAQALAPVVAGRRVVMLGEPSHGDGRSIAVRTEILKVLHEQFGFDVLVIEADFYSLNRGWDAAVAADAVTRFAADNVYPFWSEAPAAQPLWAYLAAAAKGDDPIRVSGMDIRLKGRLARTSLAGELALIAGVQPDAAATAALEDLLASDLRPASTEQQRQSLRAFLTNALGRAEDGSEGHALVASVLSWAGMAWEDESRDAGMAANLEWLSEGPFAGRKIVVWAHSNHIIRDEDVWAGIVDQPYPRHVGNLFAAGREDQVATIATVAAGGEVSTDIPSMLSGKPHDLNRTAAIRSAAPDAIESHLAECGGTSVVRLDRDGLGDGQTFTSSAVDYMAPMPMAYGLAYDALVFQGQAAGLAADPVPEP